MSVDCEIVPVRNAQADQLRQLGEALIQWCRRESGDDGLLYYIGEDVVAELVKGNWPPPFLNQIEALLDQPASPFADPIKLSTTEQHQRRVKLKRDLGIGAERLTVYFQVRGRAYANRQQIITSLRQDIPSALVDDVVIDNRSWNLS